MIRSERMSAGPLLWARSVHKAIPDVIEADIAACVLQHAVML
jgi:hypothetical protein